MEAYRAPQRPKTPEATAQKKEALLHLAGRSSLYTKGDRLLTYYTTIVRVCGVNWYHREQDLYTCSIATSVTETAFRNSGLSEQKRVNRRGGSSQPYKTRLLLHSARTSAKTFYGRYTKLSERPKSRRHCAGPQCLWRTNRLWA